MYNLRNPMINAGANFSGELSTFLGPKGRQKEQLC